MWGILLKAGQSKARRRWRGVLLLSIAMRAVGWLLHLWVWKRKGHPREVAVVRHCGRCAARRRRELCAHFSASMDVVFSRMVE